MAPHTTELRGAQILNNNVLLFDLQIPTEPFTMYNAFSGKSHAKSYSAFRPTYPVNYCDLILDYLGHTHVKDCAVDIACGSGQFTHHLAGHFRSVLGVDVSESQIEEAKVNRDKPGNIEYR